MNTNIVLDSIAAVVVIHIMVVVIIESKIKKEKVKPLPDVAVYPHALEMGIYGNFFY